MLQSINNLQNFLDVIDVPYYFFQLLCVDQLLNSTLHLEDLSGVGVHLHHSLLLPYHFFEGLNDGWDLYYLFHDFLDVLVHSDYLGDDSLDLDEFWDLYEFFSDALDLIHLWYCHGFFYDFFNDLLCGDDLLHPRLNGYQFFNNGWDFLDDFLDVWYDALYFLYGFLHDYSLNNPLNFLQFDNLLDHWHVSDHNLRDCNDPLDYLLPGDDLLNDAVDWHWDLVGDDDLAFYLDGFCCLKHLSDYFLHLDLSGHLMDEVYWHLSQHLSCYDLFLDPRHLHRSLYYLLYRFLDLNVHVFDDLNLFDLLLYDRHMHNPFNFSDYLSDHLFLYDFLYELRHFHNFLYYTWHDYHFLHYTLYLYHSWYFHHLLYDLFHNYADLLDTIDNGRHLYDFLLDVFHHFWDFHIDIDELFYFKDGGFSDYEGLTDDNFFDVH